MAGSLLSLRMARFGRILGCHVHARLTTLNRTSSNKSSGKDGIEDANGQTNATNKLNLAQPGRVRRKQIPIDVKKESQSEKSPDEEGLDREVVKAINAVASAIGKDTNKLRSDLLKKLQEHTTRLHEGHKEPKKSTVSSLISGMKPDKTSSHYRSQMSREKIESSKKGTKRHKEEEFSSESTDRGIQRDRKYREAVDIRLFEGPALGIFQIKSVFKKDVELNSRKQLFDILEEEEREKLLLLPPNNAFEEMIRWTKEGKLWKFPIDNEQGLDEEAAIGFHEHIFLEQHLVDFPKKGPIRHFMELVVVGLSKNPFFTAQEKRDHIAWYSEYFKDKYHLIDDDVTTKSVQETNISSSTS